MPNQLKRRWFQIHLLTAVIMMLVAAGLLWANTIPWKVYGCNGGPGPDQWYINYGWPFEFIFLTDIWSHRDGMELIIYPGEDDFVFVLGFMSHFDLAKNIAIACAALFSTAWISEWLMRRNRACKSDVLRSSRIP